MVGSAVRGRGSRRGRMVGRKWNAVCCRAAAMPQEGQVEGAKWKAPVGGGQSEEASRRRPVGGGQPAGGQSGALAWRPACIRLVETVKSATMPRSVCHVLRPGDSRFGRADSLSQHAAIVSRDLIFFALSAFLTKFTPVLTSFSRALWSIVHDSFCVLRFPGIVQDQGFRAWRVHLCTGWRVRWSVPSC
jgi:hypothetical protein